MQEFSRNPDRENSDRPFVWEHATEDVEIVIVNQGDVFFDVLEKDGGYTRHEIAEEIHTLEVAVSKAESYMKQEGDADAE